MRRAGAAWSSRRCSTSRSKQIRQDLESKLYFDYQPKPIAEFVDEEVAFAIGERQDDFPGRARAQRERP